MSDESLAAMGSRLVDETMDSATPAEQEEMTGISEPPPDWTMSRGLLCVCVWKYEADTGGHRLLAWARGCVTHPGRELNP